VVPTNDVSGELDDDADDMGLNLRKRRRWKINAMMFGEVVMNNAKEEMEAVMMVTGSWTKLASTMRLHVRLQKGLLNQPINWVMSSLDYEFVLGL
jgi:hypothetical protein